MTDIREAAVFFFFALMASAGWYLLYVQPADAARAEIMDCMAEQGDPHSREVYDACAAELRGGK